MKKKSIARPFWRHLEWVNRLFLPFLLAVGFMAAATSTLPAATSVHAEVLVFVPAYEGSQLFDPTLDADASDPLCVWGNYNVFFSSKRYFSLRMPNPLVAKPLMAVGPLDVYRGFVRHMTEPDEAVSQFQPYTLGTDFFIFAYDWRQEMGSVTAPLLEKALNTYAEIHASKTGIPARETKFIIVTHSMGGLVARTLLSEKPQWADRISRLYLVGAPNDGSVKSIRTVIVGPDSLQDHATGFPGVLLNLLPTDVDQNVTKLVGITRPSLYELLPYTDPNWQIEDAGSPARRVPAREDFQAAAWNRYWPSAALEKKLFLNGWLKDREAEGRKKIVPADWSYCQESGHEKLNALLAQVRAWRRTLGPLSHTQKQLTRAGEATRLRVILSTGVKTPTGVISQGAHDTAKAYYIYDSKNDGDGTMEAKRVLDDLNPNSPIIETLHGVPHGRLMIDSHFLDYFSRELKGGPTVPLRAVK